MKSMLNLLLKSSVLAGTLKEFRLNYVTTTKVMYFLEKTSLAVMIISATILICVLINPEFWDIKLSSHITHLQGLCSFLPLNMVECAGADPEDVNHAVVNLLKIDNSPKAISEIKESSTIISEGLKTIGNSIFKLAPALAGIGAGAGAAKILKTLPPAQRAGSIVAAGAFTGGVTLVSQVIAKFPNVEASSNTLNSETKQENVSSPPDFNVNSPFELEIGSLEEGLTLAIIIFTIGALYAVFTVLFNLWARSFNLESRPFVTNRPKLAK